MSRLSLADRSDHLENTIQQIAADYEAPLPRCKQTPLPQSITGAADFVAFLNTCTLAKDARRSERRWRRLSKVRFSRGPLVKSGGCRARKGFARRPVRFWCGHVDGRRNFRVPAAKD
jgi:hypothetical protein